MSENLFTYPNFPPNLEFREPHFSRYIKFIETRSLREISDNTYTKKHHIIPKSLGGSNEEVNIITLTGREHFIVHMILWKGVGGKMTYVFNMMTNFSQLELTSTLFDSLKKEALNTRREFFREYYSNEENRKKQGAHARGKTFEEIHGERAEIIKRNIRESMPDRSGGKNPFYGKKHTPETKSYISSIKKEVPWSELFGEEESNKRKIETSKRFKKYWKENPREVPKGEESPIYGRIGIQKK